jgi:hypothetical protein
MQQRNVARGGGGLAAAVAGLGSVPLFAACIPQHFSAASEFIGCFADKDSIDPQAAVSPAGQGVRPQRLAGKAPNAQGQVILPGMVPPSVRGCRRFVETKQAGEGSCCLNMPSVRACITTHAPWPPRAHNSVVTWHLISISPVLQYFIPQPAGGADGAIHMDIMANLSPADIVPLHSVGGTTLMVCRQPCHNYGLHGAGC